jgi:dipeptidyl aminopeptidase
MHTPQNNTAGYDSTAITDVKSLSKNVRFLVMHGIADDNVHMQNTATLLDKLDLAGVENYDVHFFPDSDHSIYFHNANRIVYDSKWFTPSSRQQVANYTGRAELVADQCV